MRGGEELEGTKFKKQISLLQAPPVRTDILESNRSIHDRYSDNSLVLKPSSGEERGWVA